MSGLVTLAWNVILRTTVVYVVILIGLRLAGKREIGQMTVFDLVVLLLLSNAVQYAEGSPTLLVLHGEVIADHLQREGLDQETLEAALREHGVAALSDVEMAVLEIDGSISIVPAGAPTKHVRRAVKYMKHQ